MENVNQMRLYQDKQRCFVMYSWLWNMVQVYRRLTALSLSLHGEFNINNESKQTNEQKTTNTPTQDKIMIKN